VTSSSEKLVRAPCENARIRKQHHHSALRHQTRTHRSSNFKVSMKVRNRQTSQPSCLLSSFAIEESATSIRVKIRLQNSYIIRMSWENDALKIRGARAKKGNCDFAAPTSSHV
jgi:hypothetical protein